MTQTQRNLQFLFTCVIYNAVKKEEEEEAGLQSCSNFDFLPLSWIHLGCPMQPYMGPFLNLIKGDISKLEYL